MKKIFLSALSVFLLASMQISGNAESQLVLPASPAVQDTAVANNLHGLNSFRINTESTQLLQRLQSEKKGLQKRLEEELEKRNTYVQGATPETLEEYNDRQDSICLSLKSQLVDIDLQIAEIRNKK